VAGLTHPANVWPDLEGLVIAALRAALPDVQADTETGPDMQRRLPMALVQQVPGGGGDGVVEQQSLLDVSWFAADRSAMWQLAGRGHAVLVNLDGVDLVLPRDPPASVPYNNPGVFRAISTYQITTRATGRA